MVIYVQILDQVNREKKNSMTGQMSLFDIVGEEQKSEFDIPLPNVGEYEKSTKLAFEKEVLGIYLSGHPMEEYEEQWRKSQFLIKLEILCRFGNAFSPLLLVLFHRMSA